MNCGKGSRVYNSLNFPVHSGWAKKLALALLCVLALAACSGREPPTKLVTKVEFVKQQIPAELLAACPVSVPAEGATMQSAAADALAEAGGALTCYRLKFDAIRREVSQ